MGFTEEGVDAMDFKDALKRVLTCVTVAVVSGSVILMIASISDGSSADSMLDPIIYFAGIIFIIAAVGGIFDTVGKYKASRKSEDGSNGRRNHPAD